MKCAEQLLLCVLIIGGQSQRAGCSNDVGKYRDIPFEIAFEKVVLERKYSAGDDQCGRAQAENDNAQFTLNRKARSLRIRSDHREEECDWEWISVM